MVFYKNAILIQLYHLHDFYSVYCTSSIQNIIFELEKNSEKFEMFLKECVTKEWELEFL